jgi:hypothetical protein
VPSLKMLGLGQATAILIDATNVRIVLVRPTMGLLGKVNWWLPAWLDRILPPTFYVNDTADNGPAAAPSYGRTASRTSTPSMIGSCSPSTGFAESLVRLSR